RESLCMAVGQTAARKPPHENRRTWAPIPWAMPKAVDVDGRWPISQGNVLWRKHAKLDGP
ncbi:MAG: hypothetical protein KDB00_15580, partial [Planctomycetales bacterium]|nr:hypothetical protein [Planctomycetales bacterium]